MSERTLAEAAEEYARMGYRVFPCNNEKQPMTQHGFKDASCDPGEVAAWWEETYPNANIGIATEGLYVVDIDVPKDGSRNPWLDEKPLDNIPVAQTPRGGQHHWFLQPEGSDFRCSQSKLAPNVDERANGGYVVVPPSVVNGQSYVWIKPLVPRSQLQVIPQCLLDHIASVHQPRQTRPVAPRIQSPHEIEERAAKYVDACPEAISGQRGHSSLYAVATYLVHGFCLSQQAAFNIIRSGYNLRCKPEWEDEDIWHKVKDAEERSHDRPKGWLLNAERNREPDLVDLSNLFRRAPRIVDDSRIPDPGPFPSELLHVPGFISMVVEHNLLTAHRPQPLLALAGAIELQAVLAARKVRDERDNRTNIYSIGVAQSGAGKDHARKINKKILNAIGADKLEADGLASDAGLFTTVHATPGVLFQIDEFGKFLRTLSDAKKAPHLYAIIEALLRLYSSADSSCKGKAYSDAAKNKPIEQPCVSIYATTTPDQFYESLTSDMATDGFIARLLVFESEDRSVRQRTVAHRVSEEICEAARWWFELKVGGNLSSINPEPKVVQTTEDAIAIFDALAARVEREAVKKQAGDSLWARCEEKACRLALIYACSANRENPIINKPAAEWACQLSEYLTRRLLWLTGKWVSVNKWDALQKRVIRILHDAGGRLGLWELGQRTRFIKSRERKELLADMIETGLVVAEDVPTDGKTKRVISLT